MKHLVSVGLLVALAPAALCTAPAHAGSLNPGWIAADAEWVLHVDVAGIRASKVGNYVLTHHEELNIDFDDIENLNTETGIDLRADVFDLTIYGGDDPKDDAVIVIRMNDEVDDLLEKLAEHEPSYRASEVDEIRIHSWKDDDDRIFAYVQPGTAANERIVVLAGNEPTLREGALVVLDRSANITTSARYAEIISPRPGTLIYAAATGLPWLMKHADKENPAAAVARRSDRMVLRVGESADQGWLQLQVSARSDEDARDITDVLQGVLALGRLVASQQEELAPLRDLVRSTSITAEQNEINMKLASDTEQLIECLERKANRAD